MQQNNPPGDSRQFHRQPQQQPQQPQQQKRRQRRQQPQQQQQQRRQETGEQQQEQQQQQQQQQNQQQQQQQQPNQRQRRQQQSPNDPLQHHQEQPPRRQQVGLQQQRRPQQQRPQIPVQQQHQEHDQSPHGTRQMVSAPQPSRSGMQDARTHSSPGPAESQKWRNRNRPGRGPPGFSSPPTVLQRANAPRSAQPHSALGLPGTIGREAGMMQPEGGEDEGAEDDAAWEGARTCVVCCEKLRAAAVGSCGHACMCATCAVRSRLIYSDKKCPLCKADQPSVVLAAMTPNARPAGYPPRSQAGADDGEVDSLLYDELMQAPDSRSKDAHKHTWVRKEFPKWGGWMLLPAGSNKTNNHKASKLHNTPQGQALQMCSEVESLTAITCSHCAREKCAPLHVFKDLRQLQQHAQSAHSKSLCSLCREYRKVFPSEQELMTQRELSEHTRKVHPECRFCRQRFFSSDELYAHMKQQHLACQVCERAGEVHQFFQNYDALKAHFYEAHHPCMEDVCVEKKFIVFGTKAELARHHRDFHTSHMPRWQPQHSRHLEVGTSLIQERRRAAQTQQRHPTQLTTGNLDDSSRAGPRRSDTRENSHSWQMIDDDLGTQRERAETRHVLEPQGGGGANVPRGGADSVEAFPPLPESAPAPSRVLRSTAVIPVPSWNRVEPSQSRVSTVLEKVKITCACGMRTGTAHAPAPGDPAPKALECNADCARALRRRQLANAFGQSDDSALASAQAASAFGPELLAFARKNVEWVDSVEAALAELILSTSTKRASLPAMPSQQREMVHELAKHYKVATHSYGNEPKRHVDVFCLPYSAVPLTRLSQAAKMEPDKLESVISLQKSVGSTPMAGGTFKLLFSDLGQNASVERALYAFEGRYTLEPTPGGQDDIVAVFVDERAFNQAREMLGGGMRGQYRVTSLKPSTCEPRVAVPSRTPNPSSGGSGSNYIRTRGESGISDGGWQTQKGNKGQGLTQPRAQGGMQVGGAMLVEDAWDDELKQVGCTTSATTRLNSGSGSSGVSQACSKQSQSKIGNKGITSPSKSAPPTASRSSHPGRELVVTTKNAWDLLREEEAGSDGSALDNEASKTTSGTSLPTCLPVHVNDTANSTSELGSLMNTSAGPLRWEDLAEDDSGSDWEGLADNLDQVDEDKETEHISIVNTAPGLDVTGNQEQVVKQKPLAEDPEYVCNDRSHEAAVLLEDDDVQGEDVEDWEALVD